MQGLEKEYDVVVIGGGINGLCCAAYLQKAGYKVACFERREEAGAHCSTEELMAPGVRMNLHATFLGPHTSGIAEDLELDRFGLELVMSSEWCYFHPFRDGSAVMTHVADARKQYEAWKRISPKDAEQYRRFMNYLGPRAADVFWWSRGVPQTSETAMRLAEIIRGIPGLPHDWPDMNAIQVVNQLFEDERIKATLLTFCLEGAINPWDRTVSAVFPIAALVLIPYGVWGTRGGSHSLTHALLRCFVHHGGSMFQGCPVAKIDVQDGEAKGVFLSKSAVYPEAYVRGTKAVVSDLTCRPTFIDLVGPEKLPAWVTAAASNYNYHGSILFTNYYALSGLPEWTAARQFPEVSRAFGFNWGVESVADILRLQNDRALGRLTDPPVGTGGSCQGYVIADPSQAPSGQHTLMTWCDVDYDLLELGGPDKWDEIKEQYGDKVEELLAEYIPNLKKIKLSRYVQTPLDMYRRNPSAIKGDWIAGAVTPEQSGLNRPFPGCGAPRTPIAKLYISNSITPTSGSSCGAGKSAAHQVAEDYGGRPEWWCHKALEAYPAMCAKYGWTWYPAID